MFNILDRDYNNSDLNLNNSFYKVFDELTYQFVPNIVKETWISVVRRKISNYYDYIKSKNKHNPNVIADYYTEELNHYREAKDIISKYMIPYINTIKKKEKVLLFKKGYIFDEISKSNLNKIIGYSTKGGNLSKKLEYGFRKMIDLLDIYLGEITNYKRNPKYYYNTTFFFTTPIVNRLGVYPDNIKNLKNAESFQVINRSHGDLMVIIIIMIIVICIY